MRIGLVTTWDTACGIAEHSAYLQEYVERADPTIEVEPIPEALDPTWFQGSVKGAYDLIHLNYHAALHSRWTPEAIRRIAERIPVTVTYHDTGVPNSDQCKGVVDASAVTIVHEPADDLAGGTHGAVRYWRMGVPDWQAPQIYDMSPRSWCGQRPILGTVGFPFPWKNYDQLCSLTAKLGWALLLIAPNHSAADVMRWEAINPHTKVLSFLHRESVVYHLAGCDATAFLYTCANTGQSGAVLQGIAARKPVLAFPSCRQFRALFADPLGRTAITWCETFQEAEFNLSHFTRIERVHPPIVALAEQDSWIKLGQKYASLWREVAAR